jgi:tRNA A37 threonylcarbamoyltransferase TsaD
MGDKHLTACHHLQAHAEFAFGTAMGGDVPQIMLLVPDATAQLMVSPLLMRSIFFFSRGVGTDVLRNFFNAKNILQQ